MNKTSPVQRNTMKFLDVLNNKTKKFLCHTRNENFSSGKINTFYFS